MKESRLTTQQWLQALIEPGFILSKAMSYYIQTNIKAILRGQVLAPILRSQELRDEAFGRFWVAFSSNRADPQPTLDADSQPQAQIQSPLDEIQNSTELIPSILAQASGLVLDVGPGTGTQMPLLKSPSIKAIYGAEPCVGLHAELRKRAVDEGLGAKYTILPCSVVQKELGAELEKHGLVPEGGETGGVFDTIITVRVLCSVPEFERTTAELYSLLKPGGKMLVVEHVVNPWMTPKGSVLARVLQGVYHAFGWRWVMGDCCMNRDTEGVLRKVAEKDGGWESFEMERWFGTTCLPYITGVLVKRK
ncbi:S-adenosyl-L-methionine-dependent methyltransferase [Aspergillus pseudodeflectus]|uniref:S-adenosyl-L-methionine-dependent methyltransferase n=1 Tax=Aspergillus pseudodeflectus TaxID=176178 RepID=A0ABR4KHH8_9EURO